MAFYDPLNDRIIDATPGTIEYLHEEGHQFLQRRYKYYFYAAMVERSFIPASIFLLCFGFPHPAALLIFVVMVAYGGDEVFAWIYALVRKSSQKAGV